MEEFKKKIQKRRNLTTIIFVLQLSMTVFFSKLKGFEFVMGVMGAVSLLVMFQIFQYSKALNDENKMKQLYIQENDERKLMIKKDAFQSTFQTGVILLILAIAFTVDNYEEIAKVLICVLYGFLILLLGFKVYYSKNIKCIYDLNNKDIIKLG